MGTALLKKDSFTGKKYWVTWDKDDRSREIFGEGESLMFPPEALQVGTQVLLLSPEDG